MDRQIRRLGITFVGLFGTVIGIINAFTGMAATGSGVIARSVSPGASPRKTRSIAGR